MSVCIGDGLQCGQHSKEEISKWDLILCEVIKILVNFVLLYNEGVIQS